MLVLLSSRRKKTVSLNLKASLWTAGSKKPGSYCEGTTKTLVFASKEQRLARGSGIQRMLLLRMRLECKSELR